MKSKITVIGAGSVGATIAYTLSNEDIATEIVLIDINKQKAEGEVMDIIQGTCFRDPISIKSGDYEDAKDSNIVIITSGVARKPGQSRLELTQTNVDIIKSIAPNIAKAAPNALYIIVSNPVDIITYVFMKISGIPENQIIGSGTALDTARLRYLLGDYFSVDPRNVHAYVIGEHGDSEFVPWSQAMVATKSVLDICAESGGKYCTAEMETISGEVRDAAQKIIEAKRSTYYGIGMALVRITRAIFGNESSVLTVSTLLRGEYGQQDVYAGVPCIVGRDGVRDVIHLKLTAEEQRKFDASCRVLKDTYEGLQLNK